MNYESLAGQARQDVLTRSTGRCEAMVRLPRAYARCGRDVVDIHHALKRSRGGALLDQVGETYHLIALCRQHHIYAETSGDDSGLLIDGYVTSIYGKVIYSGSDEYLKERYGPVGL